MKRHEAQLEPARLATLLGFGVRPHWGSQDWRDHAVAPAGHAGENGDDLGRVDLTQLDFGDRPGDELSTRLATEGSELFGLQDEGVVADCSTDPAHNVPRHPVVGLCTCLLLEVV